MGSRFFDFQQLTVKLPSKEEILFTGDDYVCDYEGPTKYGIDAVLLDKECIYGNVEKRIITLDQIVDYFD
jgi:putative hydrolase of the HAD superfamily